MLVEVLIAVGGNRKPYAAILESLSDLPLALPYGSNWGHNIADFVFLAFVSFIIGLRGFECVWR